MQSVLSALVLVLVLVLVDPTSTTTAAAGTFDEQYNGQGTAQVPRDSHERELGWVGLHSGKCGELDVSVTLASHNVSAPPLTVTIPVWWF